MWRCWNGIFVGELKVAGWDVSGEASSSCCEKQILDWVVCCVNAFLGQGLGRR